MSEFKDVHPLSRRQMIGSLASIPAALWLPEAQAQAARLRRTGAVDLHFHPRPPPSTTQFKSPTNEQMLEKMDRAGVATGMCMTAAMPYLWEHDVALGRRIAREFNEYCARLVHDYPGRFGLMALLPMGDTDGCLTEIAYAMDVLKADGFGLHNNYGSRWLGDPFFKPVFEELNRRKAVVHVHPSAGAPCCTPETLNYTPANGIVVYEWFMDTARAIISLTTYNVLNDTPDIRFIFSHDGGAMPMMVGRILAAKQPGAGNRDAMPEDVQAVMRKLYFDIAQGTFPPSFEIITKLTAETHVLWGSDYPPLPDGMKNTRDGLDRLRLSPKQRYAIERGNAEALFPRLRV